MGTTPPRLLDSSHSLFPNSCTQPLVEQFPNQMIVLCFWLRDFFLEEAWSPIKPFFCRLASGVPRTPLPPPPSLLQTLPLDPLFYGMLALLRKKARGQRKLQATHGRTEPLGSHLGPLPPYRSHSPLAKEFCFEKFLPLWGGCVRPWKEGGLWSSSKSKVLILPSSAL